MNAGLVGSPMNRHPNTFSKKDSARSKLVTLICVKAKAEDGLDGVAGWGVSDVRGEERRDLLPVGESGREAEERERSAFIACLEAMDWRHGASGEYVSELLRRDALRLRVDEIGPSSCAPQM